MDTRERIAVLQENRVEGHVIAAILNLDPADVAETLSDPTFTPPNPAGGGAGIFVVGIQIDVESGGDTWGGDGLAPIPAETPGNDFLPQGSVMLLEDVEAGNGNGIYFQLALPEFSSGHLSCNVNFVVCNPDGSEKFGINSPIIDLTAEEGTFYGPDMSDWTPDSNNKGEDLALGSAGRTIDSTAGGLFMAQAIVGFKARELVA